MTQVLDGGPDINLRCGLPMRGRHTIVKQGLRAGLIGTALWIIAPTGAAADSPSSCWPGNNGVWTCWVDSGTYPYGMAPIEIPGNVDVAPPVQLTANGDLTAVTNSLYNSNFVLGAVVNGVAGSLRTQGLLITNTGSLTLNAGSNSVNGDAYGLQAALLPLPGGYTYNPAGQYLRKQLTLTNSGKIEINLGGTTITGTGAALYAQALGGGGSGVAGGNSGGAEITNTGKILVDITANGYGGIMALSEGGASGAPVDGGYSLVSHVTNSAHVTAYINWAHWLANATNGGVYGILAQSVGGAGGNGDDDSNGGAGGRAQSAIVTLRRGGDVTLAAYGTAPTSNGYISPSAGVSAAVVGGDGGQGPNEESLDGGAGGHAGGATISVKDANVTTSGTYLPGLLAYAEGGAGGNGNGLEDCLESCDANQDGGAGGDAGESTDYAAYIDVSTDRRAVTISTSGDYSAAIAALAQGGLGGYGGYSNFHGGIGGNGGDGGDIDSPIEIQLYGSSQLPITLATTGDTSPGIQALSIGGAGGLGGDAQEDAGSVMGGSGGAGGTAGDVEVILGSTVVTTSGTSSPGIYALSEGGVGAESGSANGGWGAGVSGPGGAGGDSGNVTVTTYSGASISTTGSGSPGIMAQSLSGAGGNSDEAQGSAATGGNGGDGGNAGNVTIANDGRISTTGTASQGILAQSIAGAGGAGGDTSALFYGQGGTGASSGTVGVVNVNLGQSGSITTTGGLAHGILAQSIGGSGGAGGWSNNGVITVGGGTDNNPFDSDGGPTVGVVQGSITTYGTGAFGVLAQSVGGGGGDGGGASGLTAALGGAGGAGGDGSAVAWGVGVANAITQITTYGDGAAAFVAQSIGGGGGNSGNADATQAPFAAIAIGGAGGGGGDGGPVSVTTGNTVMTTVGSKSPGLVAQSVGGGGGSGGNARSGSVGPGFALAAALGGTGGSGGDGGQASVTVESSTIATGQNPLLAGRSASASASDTKYVSPVCTELPCPFLPVDSYGVLIQSVGGGGGLGGSASAKSVAINVPSDDGVSISMSMSAALGGTGGNGGDGGAVEFALSDGGQIITNGQGSTGVLAQSIGGGGGAGGDSSAQALSVGGLGAESDVDISLTATLAMGGNGGDGGDGGNVDVVIGGTFSDCTIDGDCVITQDDPDDSSPTSIVTYGDYANGVVAQSIGGGGGNAGFGSSSSQAFSTTYSLNLNVTLGSYGGEGGQGDDVRVDLYPGNGITTFGSGAIGIHAQSIGGGGGASQGGSYGIGAGLPIGSTNASTSVTVNVGTEGGGGGIGDQVVVSAMAPITTHGGDATGILAQSIGGGGGLGGSAGSDGSADNPVLQGLDARQAESNWSSFFKQNEDGSYGNDGSWSANFTVSVGGVGGTGNDGGDVYVYLYAPITTTGDWANGIIAQSVGGGGGKGGTAAASGTGGYSYVTLNVDQAIGGSGGAGGDGGDVTVELDQGNQGGSSNNNTSIRTAGFGATAVLAHSVGGGGGIGADGSDSAVGTLSVGGQAGGGGGASGSGGNVTVNYYNPDSTTIVTTGDGADGVSMQSIGGGGGIAGAGSSFFIGDFVMSGSLALSAGGSSGANGDGGEVTFEPNGADTPITIITTGDDSFGILAQSIGGGGGHVLSQPAGSSAPTLKVGGNGGSTSDGDTVTVTLGAQGSITTTGIGSHGIVAQSIGGGGGLIRLVNQSGDSPTLSSSPGNVSSVSAGVGSGGSVDVEVDGSVNVSGAGAVGILAQSVGGGGGLVMNGNTFYAGSPNDGSDPGNPANSSGYGGAVAVTVDGSVLATGANGIGIFAQSDGSVDSPQGVSVTVNGDAVGGGGQAATSDSGGNATQAGSSAIQVDSRAGSNNGSNNTVTVNGGGFVATMLGTSGTAIVQTGGGTTNATNYGTLTGSVYLGDNGTLTNDGQGVHNSGSDVVGHVVNHSVVNIGMPNEVRATRVSGDFTQTAPGRLGVTIDSLLDAADYLQVAGAASLDGVIAPTAISLLPGTVEVAEGNTLVSTAEVLDSLVFRWDASQSGNVLSITPTANFRPGGVSLNDSQASLADYFGRAWDNADRNFAVRFAGVSNINDGDTYKAALDAFSSRTALAQSIALANSAGTILGAGMSCPVFGVDTVLLGEDDCAWAQVSGSWTDQSATDDTLGYDVTTTTYRVGAQHEIARDWYLGASFGYGHNQADMDGGSSGDGDIYDGSVTLKRVMGPWQFAGSFAIAGGSFDTNRRINIPGVASDMLTSDSSMFMAGGRLRAAYEFAFEDWYVRPYGDLDLVYTDMRGFQESGGIYALDVGGSSKTSVALSPMVEFGGRLDLEGDATLRAYAAFGLSYRPDNERTVESSFVGASSGTFTDYIESPELLGRIDVGMQLFAAGGYELKGGYTADIGDSFVSQSASARLAYRF